MAILSMKKSRVPKLVRPLQHVLLSLIVMPNRTKYGEDAQGRVNNTHGFGIQRIPRHHNECKGECKHGNVQCDVYDLGFGTNQGF